MTHPSSRDAYRAQVAIETQQGWATYRQAIEYSRSADYDTALIYLAEAETTFRLCELNDGIWRTLIVQALLHYQQGVVSLAMARALAALRTASASENHVAIGWVQWQIALLALSRGDYQAAAEFLGQAQHALDVAGVAPPGGPLARSAQLCREVLRWQEIYTRGKIDRAEADQSIELVQSDLQAWLHESALAFGNRQAIDHELLQLVPISMPTQLLLPDTPGSANESAPSLRARLAGWWRRLTHETPPEVQMPSAETAPERHLVLMPQPVPRYAAPSTNTIDSGQFEVPADVDMPAAPDTSDLIEPTQALAQIRRAGLVVTMLGAFRVAYDDLPFQAWESARAREIFKYLVIARAAPVSKERLATVFWPDSEPELARRSLHQAIYCLRQTFKQQAPDLKLILFADDCYHLNPAVPIWVDVEAFQQAIEQARSCLSTGRGDEALRAYALAVDLYGGEFLAEDRYSSWTDDARYTCQNYYLEALHHLARSYVDRKDYPAAIAICQRALFLDACDESAHQLLIVCYMAQGLRHLAVRQYQTCSTTLKSQLGLTPSDELESFYRTYVAAA
jgi:DNA-binding SARP family transcriptional activator